MSIEIALPEEIITLIIKSISDPATAARCICVCSCWKSTIDRASFWRELYYSSIIPKKFEVAGDLPSDHRLNTPFWKNRVILTYGIQKSIKQRKCLPRIVASSTTAISGVSIRARTKSCNKTHCAITWEVDSPLYISSDTEYFTEVAKIGSDRSHGFHSSVVLHGNYALFCDVTPYREVDLSSITVVRFNPSTYHVDFNKPKPDPITIPNARKMAKRVETQLKYLVIASYEDENNCTVNVVDLDKRQIVFTEEYMGQYKTLVAHGTKFALLTRLGVTVVDFISKQIVFSSEISGIDALLLDDTLVYIEYKTRFVTQVDLSSGLSKTFDVKIEGKIEDQERISQLFMYQGLFVFIANDKFYFYTPELELVAVQRFSLRLDYVTDVVTLGNGNMAIILFSGSVLDVSFNPKDTEQLTELDLVEPNGNVKNHACPASDLLESVGKVNQQGEPDVVTSLYFHTTGQKRYGMFFPIFLHNDENKVAEKLCVHSRHALDMHAQYHVPFILIGLSASQTVQQYETVLFDSKQNLKFYGTIGIFCEEKVNEDWVFVKPNTDEWRSLIK